MPAIKKITTRKSFHKTSTTPVVRATHTVVAAAEDTLFPEKLQKAKDILSKTKFLPR